MNAKHKQFSGQLVEQVSAQYGPYLAVMVPETYLTADLERLRTLLGEDQFIEFSENRQSRDGDEYHITIVGPLEIGDLPEPDRRKYIGSSLTFDLVGLGKVVQENSTAYYVVVESEATQTIRAELKLDRKDLHITLGFLPEDIHNVAKDLSTLVVENSDIFDQNTGKREV